MKHELRVGLKYCIFETLKLRAKKLKNGACKP